MKRYIKLKRGDAVCFPPGSPSPAIIFERPTDDGIIVSVTNESAYFLDAGWEEHAVELPVFLRCRGWFSDDGLDRLLIGPAIDCTELIGEYKITDAVREMTGDDETVEFEWEPRAVLKVKTNGREVVIMSGKIGDSHIPWPLVRELTPTIMDEVREMIGGGQ